MAMDRLNRMSFGERLATFQGYWDGNETTATQLAAIGHVCDRPPIEALEEGSHCIACDAFIRREDSVKALEEPLSGFDQDTPRIPTLHYPNCKNLAVRVPLDSQTALSGSLSGLRVSDMRNMWERRSNPQVLEPQREIRSQSSSLFSLPTELRLEIYSRVLPQLDRETTIVPLHRDSARVVTLAAFEKIGQRDITKINIMSTCRAVHAEALDMLFNNTTYRFDSTRTLYLFLRNIGSHGRALLKSVDVDCGQREDAIAFALLASCPKLKSITLRLKRYVLLGPFPSLWTVEGVASLLHLSGLDSVRFSKPHIPRYLDDSDADAAVVRRELMRPKGTQSKLKWVDGYPDI